MIRVGLVGYGYWGPNMARNLMECNAVELAYGCEIDALRAELFERRTGRMSINRYDHLLTLPIDAVVIATPVSTHHALAKAALLAGKHVLVEKPMTDNYVEAIELRDLAEENGLILMVDHTFVYHPAVEVIKDRFDSLGRLLYVDSTRINLGLVQPDVDVIWDLATHDLAILHHLVGVPDGVRVITADPLRVGKTTNATVHLDYADGLTAAIHVSWLSPVKVRRMAFGGSKSMIVYDDIEPSEKIRVYARGLDVTAESRAVDYRLGPMLAPKVPFEEALAREVNHWVGAIHGDHPAITDGHAGVNVVRVLEACDRSRQLAGERIAL